MNFPAAKFEVARGVPFSKALTFVGTLKRWVPVPAALVSPDGSRYAISTGSAVLIVDTLTGSRTTAVTGPYNVVEFTGTDLLLSRVSQGGPPSLWVVQPGGEPTLLDVAGQLPPLEPLGYVPVGSIVWTRSRDSTSVVRIDLKTRTAAVWLSNADGLSILGLDAAGNPIIRLRGSQPSVVLLTGPLQTALLTKEVAGFNPMSALADERGIWFGNGVHDGSVWLFRPSSGLKRVAGVPPMPGSGTSDRSTRIAGPCLEW